MRKNKTQPNISVPKSYRELRRFAKQLFASLLKRQNVSQKEFMEMLKDITEKIASMGREMARQRKGNN